MEAIFPWLVKRQKGKEAVRQLTAEQKRRYRLPSWPEIKRRFAARYNEGKVRLEETEAGPKIVGCIDLTEREALQLEHITRKDPRFQIDLLKRLVRCRKRQIIRAIWRYLNQFIFGYWILKHMKKRNKKKKRIVRICITCGEVTTHKCAGCKMEFFCSKRCQRIVWTVHRGRCRRIRRKWEEMD